MSMKRQLFVRVLGPDSAEAQMEGRAHVEPGNDILDAADKILDRFNVSIEDVEVVPTDKPLPLSDHTTCRGDRYFIVIGKLNKLMHTAALSPPISEKHRHCTRMAPDSAVIALLSKNPGILRKGNRLNISTSGDAPSKTNRVVISFDNHEGVSGYIATLDDVLGANTGGTPIAAVCGLIRANPHLLWKGSRLNIDFPNELKEEPYEQYW